MALKLRESVAEILSSNISRINYENLPPDAVEATRREILDTMGLVLVGSIAQGCPALVSLAEEEGGRAESTILCYGGRVYGN